MKGVLYDKIKIELMAAKSRIIKRPFLLPNKSQNMILFFETYDNYF